MMLPYIFTGSPHAQNNLLSCLLQGRPDLCGLVGRNVMQQPLQHHSMAAFPPTDWISSSVEPVSNIMGHAPSIQSSYAPSVMSSPSLASVHQSSFDDSESTSLQECFEVANEFIMNHTDGTSNTNNSDNCLSMDVEDASALLTDAAEALAAAAIPLTNFQDNYTPSRFQPASFQPKEDSVNNFGHPHSAAILEMTAFQAAVQSVQALRQRQPGPSSSSSLITDDTARNPPLKRQGLVSATHDPIARHAEPASHRSGGYICHYPLNLPIGSRHPIANANLQTNTPMASTSFAVPSTVISSIRIFFIFLQILMRFKIV